MKGVIEKLAARMRKDSRGVTAVEYAIIAGVVAVVIFVAYQTLGTNISTEISTVAASA
jgi:pilus assembly protein Flp/PilA